MRNKLVDITPYGDGYKATVKRTPCWLARLFGAKEATVDFFTDGDGIIWFTLPNLYRVNLGTEMWLEDESRRWLRRLKIERIERERNR